MSASPRSTPAAHSSVAPTVTEFRFDDDGSLVDLAPDNRPVFKTDIDLRSTNDDEPIEHLVQLSSGDVVAVVGANAYQPEGPMTTFFSTGSSRGMIDSWSVRIASYRTNDIVSIRRCASLPVGKHRHRPNLVAV